MTHQSSSTRRLYLLSIFFIFFFFIYFTPGADAIYAHKSFYVKTYVTVFQKFGYETNGTFALAHDSPPTFDPPEANTSIFFYLCTDDQWRSHFTTVDVKTICSSSNSTQATNTCELSHLSFYDERLYNYTVRSASLYYFVALRCFNSPIDEQHQLKKKMMIKEKEMDMDAMTMRMMRMEMDSDGDEVAFIDHITDDDDISPFAQERTHDIRSSSSSSTTESNERGATLPMTPTTTSGGSAVVVEMSLTYTLLNPGGRHLSIGNAPLPTLYSVFMAWWGWLTLMYGFILLLKHRYGSFSVWTPPGWDTPATGTTTNRKMVVALHGVLEVVLVSRLAMEGSGMLYWRLCDSTGQCYVHLSYLQSFLFAISESFLFAVLLLVAKGWKITRAKLPQAEVRSIAMALLLLLSTLLIFSLYNESYYYFSLLILYIFMLPKIFTAINKNIKRLTTLLALVSRFQQHHQRHQHHQQQRLVDRLPRVSTINARLHVFKWVRLTVGAHLAAFLALSVVRVVMPWRLLWLNNCLQEFTSIIVIGALLYLLAPDPDIFYSEAESVVVDEESLPWLYRSILQRLMEEDEDDEDHHDAASAIAHFLTTAGGNLDDNEDENDDENDDDVSNSKSSIVDFGEGHVSSLSQLIVFEFPHSANTSSSTTTTTTTKMMKEEGKGKAIINGKEEEEETSSSTTSPTSTSGRYFAIGTVERPPSSSHKKDEGDDEDEEGDEGDEGKTSRRRRRRRVVMSRRARIAATQRRRALSIQQDHQLDDEDDGEGTELTALNDH